MHATSANAHVAPCSRVAPAISQLHPLEDSGDAAAAATHWWLPLQTAGDTQSATLWHEFAHVPDVVQRYGVQSWTVPLADTDVCVSLQNAPAFGVHAPEAHPKPVAQSESTAHVVLQVEAPWQPKLFGHDWPVPGTQAPLPLHALGVSVPPSHAGLAHSVVLVGKTHAAGPPLGVHDAPQTVPAPASSHCGRAPCGAPFTTEHVPTEPATSQAWHFCEHAVSQQTPSTQSPVAH
jgi:hypothetical protein